MKIKKLTSKLLYIILVILLMLSSYVIYMQVQYYRIADNTREEIKNNTTNILEANTKYSIMSYNLGFGAYSPKFSFFMDSAILRDSGKIVHGKYGKALSKEDVLDNTQNAISIMKENNCDFYLLQEVDKKSTRSYFINQVLNINENFKDYASVFSSNFHSAFLAYPLFDMHGSVESGILTLSNKNIESSTRRSFPVSKKFLDKFFDLDRCFTVNRLKVSNGKELVLVNTHMSAYDKGGIIRKKQLEVLNSFLKEEYEKENYVIVGGDFNHDYCNSRELFLGDKTVPESLSILNDNDLSSGYSFVIPQNRLESGTCRGAETPYDKNTTYQSIIDGFIISDNIKADSKIINTEYKASDHNPIILDFLLE